MGPDEKRGSGMGIDSDGKHAAYEYTTFPRQFVTYAWYKPLLVGALTALFTFLSQGALFLVTGAWLGSLDAVGEAMKRSSEHFFSGPGALSAIGGVAAVLPALAIAVRIVQDRPFSSYSSSRGGWNWVAFGKCLIVAVVILGSMFFGEALFFPDSAADGIVRFSVIGAVMCVVLVPIQAAAEEYLYRGLLMQTIGSWTGRPLVAVVLSSIIFAISHSYGVLGIIAVLVDGLGFAFLTWYSKGLEASSATHAINNLMAFFFTGLGIAPTSEGGMESLAVSVAMMAAYCVAIVVLDRKFGWFTSRGDGTGEFNERHQLTKEPDRDDA